MTATTEKLAAANEALRAAVTQRLSQGVNSNTHEPQVTTWSNETASSESYAEWLPPKYAIPTAAEVIERFSPTHPTSQAFFDLCDQLKAMHRAKSSDYGCPHGTDPLANIRNGARFVGIPEWKAAMVRLSDKVTRLATFNATGSLTFEGVEDNLFDLASYALLSLLLYREAQNA